MGSTAVAFPYGLAVAAASAIPLLAASLWSARQRQVADLAVAAVLVLVGTVTAVFHLSGAAGCDDLGLGPGQDLFFFTHVGLLIVLTGLATIVARRRGEGLASSAAIAGGLVAISSFLTFLLHGHCHNSASMILREWDVLVYAPLWFIVALLGVALGALLRFLARRAQWAGNGEADG